MDKFPNEVKCPGKVSMTISQLGTNVPNFIDILFGNSRRMKIFYLPKRGNNRITIKLHTKLNK